MSGWLVLGAIVCAVAAIHSRSLVHSALWLAATSAVLATLLYVLGAPVVAVVELSVGVGLVAVLFIFVVGVAGEGGMNARSVVPTIVALALAGPAVALLAWMVMTGGQLAAAVPATGASASVSTVLWESRAADVLGQVVLVVAGALGVVTILGGAPRHVAGRTNGAAKSLGGSISVIARPMSVPTPPQAPSPPLVDETREPVAARSASTPPIKD